MEEIERCRTYARMAWELLAQQPALALPPAGAVIPALLILAAPDSWTPEGPPRLFPLFVLLALVQAQVRQAFSHSIFDALRAYPWTALGALREGLLHPTRSSILFGLIDGAATGIALIFLAYVPFGAFAAGPWWCMASLVSCAFASGIDDLDGARRQAQRVFSIARMELLVSATVVNMVLGLVLQLIRHFGLPPLTAFAIFYITAMIPARELAWQLFVSILYDHTPAESHGE